MFSYFTRSSSSSDKPPSETPPPQQDEPQQQQPPQQQRKNAATAFPPNLRLLFGGMTFFAVSLLMTRRALRKRHLSSIPPYYTSSTYHKPEVNGAMDAFEALNLATVNVLSFGMLGTGAVLCKLDINSLEDARGIVRRAYAKGGVAGKEGGNAEDELAEQEIEAWVVKTFGLTGYEEKKKEIVDKRLESEKADGKSSMD